PALLGEQARLLHAEGRPGPGGRQRLPGRALPGAEELGGAGVSQAHPLQQASQGRTLRRLGAAEVPQRRDSRRLQVRPFQDRKLENKEARARVAGPLFFARSDAIGGRNYGTRTWMIRGNSTIIPSGWPSAPTR